jgi:hypothetical protein
MATVGSSIVAQDSGVAFFAEFDGVTTGALQALISFTVPSNITRSAHLIIVTCRQQGAWVCKVDGSKIASGKTGPSEMNVQFPFNPIRPIAADASVVVEFTPLSGRPNSDIEAYFMGSDV